MNRAYAGAGLVVLLTLGGLAAVPIASAEAPAIIAADPVVEAISAPAANDAGFVTSARNVTRGSNFDQIADADLIALGHTFCDAINAGATRGQFAKSAELMKIPAGTYRSFLVIAQSYYCPNHLGWMF